METYYMCTLVVLSVVQLFTSAQVIQISNMSIATTVTNRFAHTFVTTTVKNLGNDFHEGTFSFYLPNSAYISGFIIEDSETRYTSQVESKQATASATIKESKGSEDVRDSSHIEISVGIVPQSEVTFYMSYEELLKRKNGHYQIITNIFPRQYVTNLSVEVVIIETRKISSLKRPYVQSGKEIMSENSKINSKASISIVNTTTIKIVFSPDVKQQELFATLLQIKQDHGFGGQLVIDYDVERNTDGGELFVKDGYFTHFFAPANLPALPKYVVFVLDTSRSMEEVQKLEQLKQAMMTILDELNENDTFSLLEFDRNVKTWDIIDDKNSVWYPSSTSWHKTEPSTDIEALTFPSSFKATKQNKIYAKEAISKFTADGPTNIFGALKVALHLIRKNRNKNLDGLQPIIIFLTDGEPMVGLTDKNQIVTEVTALNADSKRSTLFALGFGPEVDHKFLQKLALNNTGSFKFIYEGTDASLQFENFYKEISTPLLTQITFRYSDITTVSVRPEFSTLNEGSEIMITGMCDKDRTCVSDATVQAVGLSGPVEFKPVVEQPVGELERQWAFATIQYMLSQKNVATNPYEQNYFIKEATDLSLQYSYATPVTSMVINKPYGESTVLQYETDEKDDKIQKKLFSKKDRLEKLQEELTRANIDNAKLVKQLLNHEMELNKIKQQNINYALKIKKLRMNQLLNNTNNANK